MAHDALIINDSVGHPSSQSLKALFSHAISQSINVFSDISLAYTSPFALNNQHADKRLCTSPRMKRTATSCTCFDVEQCPLSSASYPCWCQHSSRADPPDHELPRCTSEEHFCPVTRVNIIQLAHAANFSHAVVQEKGQSTLAKHRILGALLYKGQVSFECPSAPEYESVTVTIRTPVSVRTCVRREDGGASTGSARRMRESTSRQAGALALSPGCRRTEGGEEERGKGGSGVNEPARKQLLTLVDMDFLQESLYPSDSATRGGVLMTSHAISHATVDLASLQSRDEHTRSSPDQAHSHQARGVVMCSSSRMKGELQPAEIFCQKRTILRMNDS